jgi:hypothetical protein
METHLEYLWYTTCGLTFIVQEFLCFKYLCDKLQGMNKNYSSVVPSSSVDLNIFTSGEKKLQLQTSTHRSCSCIMLCFQSHSLQNLFFDVVYLRSAGVNPYWYKGQYNSFSTWIFLQIHIVSFVQWTEL